MHHTACLRPISLGPPPAHHVAVVPDLPFAGTQETLQRAVDTVRRMPPLVFAGECRTLQERLAQCAAGNAFMLQVCAATDPICERVARS